MRVLTHLEKDSKQDLSMNAALLLSELYKRFKLKNKELENIIKVSRQMATIEGETDAA